MPAGLQARRCNSVTRTPGSGIVPRRLVLPAHRPGECWGNYSRSRVRSRHARKGGGPAVGQLFPRPLVAGRHDERRRRRSGPGPAAGQAASERGRCPRTPGYLQNGERHSVPEGCGCACGPDADHMPGRMPKGLQRSAIRGVSEPHRPARLRDGSQGLFILVASAFCRAFCRRGPPWRGLAQSPPAFLRKRPAGSRGRGPGPRPPAR